MKIIWFTNIALSETNKNNERRVVGSGSWMEALLDLFRKQSSHSLAIICATSVPKVNYFSREGVDYYLVPQSVQLKGRQLHASLKHCGEIITQLKPDIVHIHGTERYYGLLKSRNYINAPVVISLQGIVTVCAEWYRYFGNTRFITILKMHRLLELFVFKGEFRRYLTMQRQSINELEIIKNNRFFIGRTQWDKAFLLYHNPDAIYYTVNEAVRAPFWSKQWKLECAKKHRIIFTNCGHPRKGADIVFEAVASLIKDFPDIELCLVGSISKSNGWGRYIRKSMKKVQRSIKELGPLNAEDVAIQLCASHVFVSASYIENSSNSISEAQLIGMPVIAPYTGGLPSLIEEGKTGLFYPTGEPHMLSQTIRTIFENDSLAISVGSKSREIAQKRHDPEMIFNKTISVYDDVITQSHQST